MACTGGRTRADLPLRSGSWRETPGGLRDFQPGYSGNMFLGAGSGSREREARTLVEPVPGFRLKSGPGANREGSEWWESSRSHSL